MKKKTFLTTLTFGMILLLVGCSKEISDNEVDYNEVDGYETIEEMYNSDIYEFIDKETGVHYLIYSHKAGYGGMGGITPRLNSDGSIMIDEVGNESIGK